MDAEMMRALEADGEKLRQMTGEDHGPVFLGGCPKDTACSRCEGGGQITEGRATSAGGTEDIAHPCPECDGDGSWFTQWLNGFGPYAAE